MFENTNLSLESVEIIADTIHDFSGETKIGNRGMINISWHTLSTDEKTRNDLVEALNEIVKKGWHIQKTNSELTNIAQSKGYTISSGEFGEAGFFSGGNGYHGFSPDFF